MLWETGAFQCAAAKKLLCASSPRCLIFILRLFLMVWLFPAFKWHKREERWFPSIPYLIKADPPSWMFFCPWEPPSPWYSLWGVSKGIARGRGRWGSIHDPAESWWDGSNPIYIFKRNCWCAHMLIHCNFLTKTFILPLCFGSRFDDFRAFPVTDWNAGMWEQVYVHDGVECCYHTFSLVPL